ncbi:MAG TPA: hypothetical protein VI072_03115 [Polyangiaceae bacterium]
MIGKKKATKKTAKKRPVKRTAAKKQPPAKLARRKERTEPGYERKSVTDPFPAHADQMKAALKAITEPAFRQLGFQGSFPKYRRISRERHDVAWFMFGRAGSAVAVALAVVAAKKGSTLSDDYGRARGPRSQRTALQAETKYSPGIRWFILDDDKLGAGRFDEIAKLLAKLMETQGEKWFHSGKARKSG